MTDTTSTPITDPQLREVALTRAEYRCIVQTLEHKPNPLELGIAGAVGRRRARSALTHARRLVHLVEEVMR